MEKRKIAMMLREYVVNDFETSDHMVVLLKTINVTTRVYTLGLNDNDFCWQSKYYFYFKNKLKQTTIHEKSTKGAFIIHIYTYLYIFILFCLGGSFVCFPGKWNYKWQSGHICKIFVTQKWHVAWGWHSSFKGHRGRKT